MAFSLHAHHFHYPEYLREHSEEALLGVYIVALAIVIIAMLVAGVSLFQQNQSFIPMQ